MGTEDEDKSVRGLNRRASSMRSESSTPTTSRSIDMSNRRTNAERNESTFNNELPSSIINSSDDESESDLHRDSKDL